MNQIRKRIIVGVGLLAMGVSLVSGARTQPDEVIRDQEGTVRVGLSNGLELVVVSTRELMQGAARVAPSGEAQVWLVVRAGSMYESDAQRGSAMVIERAIRRGTVHYSAQEIDELLIQGDEGDGEGDGEPGGSFVGFDQAGYMGRVDLDEPQAIGRVLRFFGELLDPDALVLDDERIGASIDELLGELENEPNVELRSRQRWLPTLLGSSLFGDRLPKASPKAYARLTPDQVRGFARAFYHPGQAMVIVVGDVDAKAIEHEVARAMGKVEPGERRVMIDGRLKVDVSMRAVMDTDPGFEKHQGAMVWFRDRDQGSDRVVEPWTVRAGRYTLGDMRETVISRVAGEIIRNRLIRQGTQVLGTNTQVGVDQMDLFGQVDVLQIGIESPEGSWADSIGFMVQQCDRLGRDGASDDEIGRARRSVLARWHRDADDWVRRDADERMGLVHWLITTGRPMIDMMRWDRLATELMAGIRDDEIQDAVRGLIDTKQASYIALSSQAQSPVRDGSQDQTGAGLVLGVVKNALATPIEAIDPNWMEQLADSLIDSEPVGAQIEEITQHAQSGVWNARLSNGVELWTRVIDAGGGDERFSLTATLWSGALDDGRISDEQIDAALIAWRQPTSESRSSRAISAYRAEHEIKVSARHEGGYVQLKIDASNRSAMQAMELAYVLLDRPMIEPQEFEDWRSNAGDRKSDIIDDALAVLYPNDRWVESNGEHGPEHGEVTLDDAQRVLTQIVRNSRVDIGMVGTVGTAVGESSIEDGLIEEGARLFGSLVSRAVDSENNDPANQYPLKEQGDGFRSKVFASERVIQVSADQAHDPGVAIGLVSGHKLELRSLRSLILSAMVLSDRLKERVDDAGLEGSIRANIWTSDALPHQPFLMVRAWCSQGDFEQVGQMVDETIESMVRDGISEDELGRVQDRIDESIAGYFDSPRYWSVRLSMLGFNGRRVDDLWRIREGYREISAQDATRVLSELLAGNDRFRIEIMGSE